MIRIRLSPDRGQEPWREWLARNFASYTSASFGERHVRYWEWITALRPGSKPRPRIECWPRGGGKSATAELACAYLGASSDPGRHYVLYVSETQAQANRHVQAIASMLQHVGMRRAVNDYGSSKGWRHAEIRTANGFNVTAFGLDSGMRGVKLDEFRPDVIVFDDIDGRHDTPEATRKKIDVITTTVLPAGSADCAVVVVQNKIAQDSIVSQLCDGRADFLHDRLPATVEPAVRGLQYERIITDDGTPRSIITAGAATWAGQDLAICERQINDWGLDAFLREAQHEVDEVEGGLWDPSRDIDPWRVDQVPQLHRIGVSIDPSASSTGDATGIIVGGIANSWNGAYTLEVHGYVLDDRTVSGSPKTWAEAAVVAYRVFNADVMIAEKNNGGEMVSANIASVPGAPSVRLVHASRGKITRAEPIQKLYEDGRIHHIGVFPDLEHELRTYTPGRPSPNRMDALVHLWTQLLLDAPDSPVSVSGFKPLGRADRHRRGRAGRASW